MTEINSSDVWVLYLIVRESLGMSAGKIGAQCSHGTGMIYEKYAHLQIVNIEIIQKNKKLENLLNKYYGSVLMQETQSPPIEVTQIQAELAHLKLDYHSNEEKLFQMSQWKQNHHRKVVLGANDKEFEIIKEELECFVVQDAGFTEVSPGTFTCLSLWPMKKSEAPKLIKRLQVLK